MGGADHGAPALLLLPANPTAKRTVGRGSGDSAALPCSAVITRQREADSAKPIVSVLDLWLRSGAGCSTYFGVPNGSGDLSGCDLPSSRLRWSPMGSRNLSPRRV